MVVSHSLKNAHRNSSQSIQLARPLFFPMSSSLVALPASYLSNKTFRLFKFSSGKGPFWWHRFFTLFLTTTKWHCKWTQFICSEYDTIHAAWFSSTTSKRQFRKFCVYFSKRFDGNVKWLCQFLEQYYTIIFACFNSIDWLRFE